MFEHTKSRSQTGMNQAVLQEARAKYVYHTRLAQWHEEGPR